MSRHGTACAALALLLAAVSVASCRTILVRKNNSLNGTALHDLGTAIAIANDGDTIIIGEGTWEASPDELVEELCGNCEEHATRVEASAGFVVRGKAVHLVGSGTGRTVLRTNAGYGLYFEDSDGSSVSALTITGGVRDSDGAATDGGVVARRSRVTITGVEIADNTDRADEVVVGIGGVIGREGSVLAVHDCVIRNNGWDGVALYRGATALVMDTRISDGRGAGVGVTWDAAAIVCRNEISRYWKGIGTFGSSRAVIRNNIVRDNLGWGVVATGTSTMEAANNVIVRNGNCGFALWSDAASGLFTNNVVAWNGWRDEWVCPRVGIWMNGDPAHMPLEYNDVWANVEGDYRDMDDLTGTLGNISVEPAFVGSLDFRPRAVSPLVDAGNPIFTDPDGTRSDIGISGGPAAAPPGARHERND
ncbi:MAG: hypothetical protein GF405_00240 [Candidatus Eisenbacteria bacterium]|nr:hypothetical protein [Candidatus Eisenbacteria bacterium]